MKHLVRIPERFTAQLLKLPEQGMGFQVVDVVLRDGRVFNAQVILDASFWQADEDVQPEIIESLHPAPQAGGERS